MFRWRFNTSFSACIDAATSHVEVGRDTACCGLYLLESFVFESVFHVVIHLREAFILHWLLFVFSEALDTGMVGSLIGQLPILSISRI